MSRSVQTKPRLPLIWVQQTGFIEIPVVIVKTSLVLCKMFVFVCRCRSVLFQKSGRSWSAPEITATETSSENTSWRE